MVKGILSQGLGLLELLDEVCLVKGVNGRGCGLVQGKEADAGVSFVVLLAPVAVIAVTVEDSKVLL